MPGLVAALTAMLDSRSDPPLETAVGLLFWFLFSAPVVFVVGIATLYLSLKIKGGPIFIPPAVGGISGFLLAKAIYAQGENARGLLLFTLCGVATALVAMLIYFIPRIEKPTKSNAQG